MTFLFRKKKTSDQHIGIKESPKFDYRAVAKTDVGSVRANNEDHLIFIRPFDEQKRLEYGCLALVADGMGGHSSGEIASRMAVEIISKVYYEAKNPGMESLKLGFEKANKAIYKKAKSNPSLKGMGTTCTAVVLLGDQIIIGHVGDSRAYLLKDSSLFQLSKDDTYVQFLMDEGKITEEESLNHPQRNIVTKALGTTNKLRASFSQDVRRIEEKDKLFLCSDGLYEYIKSDELKSTLEKEDINQTADLMIELAKQRGGHDNISVLIVEACEKESNEVFKQTIKID